MRESKQSDFIKNLGKWGFKTSDLNKTIKGTNNLVKYHSEIEKKRFNLNYDIDGIVYKVNDFSLQKRLGLWPLLLDGLSHINSQLIIQ